MGSPPPACLGTGILVSTAILLSLTSGPEELTSSRGLILSTSRLEEPPAPQGSLGHAWRAVSSSASSKPWSCLAGPACPQPPPGASYFTIALLLFLLLTAHSFHISFCKFLKERICLACFSSLNWSPRSQSWARCGIGGSPGRTDPTPCVQEAFTSIPE